MASGTINREIIPFEKSWTVTTSYSGAVSIPLVSGSMFMYAYTTESTPMLIYRRDVNYLTVKNSETLAPIQEQTINIKAVYMPI